MIRKEIRWEPSPRRVRVQLAGTTIADTTAAMLMCEPGHVPVYYFPLADIRMDLMRRTEHRSTCPHKGVAAYWTAEAGGRVSENALWAYPEPLPHAPPGLKDYAAFYWDRVDRWLEEDEEIFAHARDPRKRVDVVPSRRRVEVVVAGKIVAESRRAMFLFETDLPTRYYLPREYVDPAVLQPSPLETRCPYKGIARYHDVTVGGRIWPNLVWYYPEPIPECPKIAGRLAFFEEKVDEIRIDGKTMPRPVTKWS